MTSLVLQSGSYGDKKLFDIASTYKQLAAWRCVEETVICQRVKQISVGLSYYTKTTFELILHVIHSLQILFSSILSVPSTNSLFPVWKDVLDKFEFLKLKVIVRKKQTRKLFP